MNQHKIKSFQPCENFYLSCRVHFKCSTLQNQTGNREIFLWCGLVPLPPAISITYILFLKYVSFWKLLTYDDLSLLLK